MFVRWKRRKMRGFFKGDSALTAVLVASTRIHGQPRQRFACYLGTIRDSALTYVGHRRAFWNSVDAHLTAYGASRELRAQVEAKVLTVVQRPTTTEQEQWEREMQAMFSRLRSA